MGKKVTYERWINLFLPDGWNEREEMGFVLLEKEGWPGMLQLSFIEREETKNKPAEAARNYLEDTLEERDIPFPREAVKVEDRGDHGYSDSGLYVQGKGRTDPLAHLVSCGQDRALMAAYVCNPEFDNPHLAEATRIISDIEFISCTND